MAFADDDGRPKEEAIKYPIDDLLVHSGADDPVFTQRPSLCRDFNVPMDCVGELIMVWDFCSSFSRLLNLWPFSLEDFENALCHKESNVVLIVECHSALLRLLIKDSGDYFTTIQKKKRKPKVRYISFAFHLIEFSVLASCVNTVIFHFITTDHISHLDRIFVRLHRNDEHC